MKKKTERTVDHSKEEEDVYPAEEQGIEEDLNSEDTEEAMEHGEVDEDVYSEEGLEKLEEDDEIDPWEEGFMEGASKAGQLGKDALTGELLMDVEDVVEAEINGKMYRFVSEENADKFRKKKEKERNRA
ncbi:MAG TPA: hypothetical protein VJC39_05675 [Candidatus Nanoarchaeia archaeon]|nr:hypothetical protein [Candidatus Nanoarchaeia archaeon]